MPPVPRPVALPAAHDHTATRLETDEDVLNALRANLAGMPVAPLPVGPAAPAPSEAAQREAPVQRPPAVAAFRPSLRPPMAILTVFDDGKHEGEQIRLRESKFVIGRIEGDLVIPHDNMISSKHVEITRQQTANGYRWILTDLQSTNGLFVRVLKTLLNDRSEILVGKGRYRFLAPLSELSATADYVPVEQARNSTQAWGADGSEPAIPSLVEIVGNGFGSRQVLTRSEYWIGADPSCAICRTGDPYCEARHARLYRDKKGNWQVEHNKSINGLWFRLPQVTAESTVQFQIGEQRFKLQLGS